MLFALDKEGNKVHINSADRREDYFCPCCGSKMILKNGSVRIAHFAHRSESFCKDSWHYDMTEWHYDWQRKFPKECQEVVKEYGGEKHMADVLIEKNKAVFEFQHSQLSPDEFEERNDFYNKLGYKVIWIFDVVEQYWNESIDNYRDDLWFWKHPRRTFDYYNYNNKKVELYLQIDVDDVSLIKVTWCTEDKGLARFATDGIEYDESSIVDMFSEKSDTSRKGYKISELFDRMIELNHQDHTTYYLGCPISKTHKCADWNIDIPSRMYDEIMPCTECKYQYPTNCQEEIICRKRFMDLPLDKDVTVKIENKDEYGFINRISYIDNGKIKYLDIPTFEGNFTKNIFEIWNDDYAFAIFRNVRTDIYVKITKNPKEQYSKYHKVYGWFSKDKHSFDGKSCELYDVGKSEWVLYRCKIKQD